MARAPKAKAEPQAAVIDVPATVTTTAIAQRGDPTIEDLAELIGQPGLQILSSMSDSDFEKRLVEMKKGLARLDKIKREILIEDKGGTGSEGDYGIIPGTKKDSLYKGGAEKLCNIFSLVPSFEIDTTYGNGKESPWITTIIKAKMHLGHDKGPVVGAGVGACSSHETKYRYRTAERACPACGVIGCVRKSDAEWYCWRKIGGCGKQFELNDPGITSQGATKEENKDPFEVLNTIVKMACIRAHKDATLRATASSSLFTQDLDDYYFGSGDGGRAHGMQQEGQRAGADVGHQPAPAAATSSRPAAVKAEDRPSPDEIQKAVWPSLAEDLYNLADELKQRRPMTYADVFRRASMFWKSGPLYQKTIATAARFEAEGYVSNASSVGRIWTSNVITAKSEKWLKGMIENVSKYLLETEHTVNGEGQSRVPGEDDDVPY